MATQDSKLINISQAVIGNGKTFSLEFHEDQRYTQVKEVAADGEVTYTRVTSDEGGLKQRVVVTQENHLSTICGTIDSKKEYFLDGEIVLSAPIVVPSTGITIKGYSFDISALMNFSPNFTMFTSPVGGSGNILLEDLYILVNGADSQVFDVTDATGFNAWEFNKINYIACTSLGEINNYRQGLESGTGRFSGSPYLTLSGNMLGGARITTSITRSMDDTATGSLFSMPVGSSMSGRFITDMNVDLGTNSSFIDFSPNQFTNDESCIFKGAFITRDGVVNSADTNITPNIAADDVQCLWSDNTGLPNTYKNARMKVNTEVETVVSAVDTYYPLEGTYALSSASHFDSPSNGVIRCLSGSGVYNISGNFNIVGQQNVNASLRVTKSTDGGATFPIEIDHITRVVNNLQGGRDIAIFPINFLAQLDKNDQIRVEIENYTNTTNFTAEVDSYIIVSST